jgi:hypothetical protein
MKLTIKNIANIVGQPIPRLPDFHIIYVEGDEFHYYISISQSDVMKYKLTLNRDENYNPEPYIEPTFGCTIRSVNGIGEVSKKTLLKENLKTKLGFIMTIAELIESMEWKAKERARIIAGLPSVSAGTHITQSLSTLHAQIQKNNGF